MGTARRRCFLVACALLSCRAAPAPAGGDDRHALPAAEARRLVDRVHPGPPLLPASWPGGRRVAVALTFDVDGELVWGHPARVSFNSLSRGRFGIQAGLPRILEMLDRRGHPATFFFPALVLEMHPGALEAVRARPRHAIGYHGYGHEDLRTLSPAQERDALRRGLEIFARHGLKPRVFRSPSFDFTPATLGLLEEHGFDLDSSLMADDRPHVLHAGDRASGVLEIPVDWSLDDWPYFQLEWATPLPGLRAPEEVLAIWREEFEGVRGQGGVFVLTLHPQCIGRHARLRMLERLLDHIEGGGDAWFATLPEIGDHVRGSRPRTPRSFSRWPSGR